MSPFLTARLRSSSANERPPLLVKVHGGPTAACSSNFNALIQYWTSRGFAILDVNYGGSTGYGRRYRQRLNGQWGVVDVDDCVNGALYLARTAHEVDEARLTIDGGSAGGFTTLAVLAFRDVFKAGCRSVFRPSGQPWPPRAHPFPPFPSYLARARSNYGVTDLERLALDTHKFEARYLDTLVGPYPAAIDVYRARSPIHHLEGLNCPTILFQGDEDKVRLRGRGRGRGALGGASGGLGGAGWGVGRAGHAQGTGPTIARALCGAGWACRGHRPDDCSITSSTPLPFLPADAFATALVPDRPAEPGGDDVCRPQGQGPPGRVRPLRR